MRHGIITLLATTVAACNQGPSVAVTNASVGEVAARVATATADSAFVLPGRWESNVRFDKIEMPGMPPEIAEKMNAGMARNSNFATCLTPEDAKQPNGSFFGGDAAKGCTYEHFTLSGGKIDAAMTCSRDGHRQTMTMKGSFSPESYEMAMTSQASGTAPAGAMRMAMSVSAKRTGACTGKEPRAKAEDG